MKFLRGFLFASTMLLSATAAVAASTNPLADREDKIIPAVLLWMQETGVKLTYLGNEGGIRGYLAEFGVGNMQTIYVTPDNKNIVLGLLYGADFDQPGSNITGRQLTTMRERYNSVADAVSKIGMDGNMSLAEAMSKITFNRPDWDLEVFPAVSDQAEILNVLRSRGYNLTSIGAEGGVLGFFAKKDRISQTLYVTPDGKHFILGLMLERGGKNVTGVQLGEMRARFVSADQAKTPPGAEGSKVPAVQKGEETAPLVNDEAKAKAPASMMEILAPKSSDTATIKELSLPDTSDSSAEPKVDVIAPPADVKADAPAPIPVATPDLIPQQDLSIPAGITIPQVSGPVEGDQGNLSAFWYSQIDKDTFLEAVRTASFFDVGSETARKTIYMVADPNCPYCHKTWDYLKKFVTDRKVKVRVIMIAFLPGSDEKARVIMKAPSPGNLFMASNGGRMVKVTAEDASSPDWKAMAGHLENNSRFARKFKIDRTPFLAYEDNSGQFYASNGVPQNDGFDAFFAALGMAK